jgi:translation initiation factor 2 subunit 1
MLFRKEGFPEEGELVLVTVTSVQHHTVFCTLDEYGGRTAIIHISEIAPGRIRNIRDYVSEGKKVVCKVLRINRERGHIDLSLRRVNEAQRRMKNDQLKKEQLAEKIIEFVANDLKKKMEEVYRPIAKKVLEKYPYVYSCFEDVIQGGFDLKELGLDAALTQKLDEAVRQRIKPPQVIIDGAFTLISHASDGVEHIKQALKPAKRDGVTLKYLGGGKYKVTFVAEDFKTAEDILEEVTEKVLEAMRKSGGEADFVREEGEKV